MLMTSNSFMPPFTNLATKRTAMERKEHLLLSQKFVPLTGSKPASPTRINGSSSGNIIHYGCRRFLDDDASRGAGLLVG